MSRLQMTEQLESALQAAASESAARSLQRYFTAPVVALGVSNGEVRAIAAAVVAAQAQLGPDDYLAVADHFARSHRYHEHFIMASSLARIAVPGMNDDGQFLALAKTWLERDASNWAQCDDLCIKPLHVYLRRKPHLLSEIITWGTSDGSWCRRASCVALVKFVGRTKICILASILANCERLLADCDPYVQKAVGWILKVAAQYQPHIVIDFLHHNAERMESATLRYAIEKLPPAECRRFKR